MTLTLTPLRKIFAALGTSAVLAACTSHPARPPGGAHATLHIKPHDTEQFALRGYLTPSRQSVISHREQRTTPAGEVDMLLLLPERGGPYPLVVYLPGLGEAIDAGQIWRQAWAEAGYAVLSLQLMSDGPAVWASPAARSGDFAGIARQSVAPARVRSRTTSLYEILADLTERTRQDGNSPYARIDIDHIVLAGFELGATGALAAAGSATTQGEGASRIVAIIAIAPLSAAGRDHDHDTASPATPPVLYVSGRPGDRYRLGRSAPDPDSPDSRLMHEDSYVLDLPEIDHMLLSGALVSALPRESGRGRAAGEMPGGGPNAASSGGGPGRPGPGSRPMPGMNQPPDGLDPRAAGEQERARVAIRSVTLAFLDAYVQRDSTADRWLYQRANGWLGSIGELRWK